MHSNVQACIASEKKKLANGLLRKDVRWDSAYNFKTNETIKNSSNKIPRIVNLVRLTLVNHF